MSDCKHPRIVPIDRDWARCTTCGDSTFPISAHSAGLDAETPRQANRLWWWVIALAAALVASIASHTCDSVRHRHEMRQCVERAP